MIHVTLKDGSVKEFENGISVMEIVKGLGAGLYQGCLRLQGKRRTVRPAHCSQ